jgi:hypothetical protein
VSRTQARLLEVEADDRPRWSGNVLPVPLGHNCPAGHGPLLRVVADQPSLFRHGGAGATVRTTHRVCTTCFWSIDQVDTVKDGVPGRLG